MRFTASHIAIAVTTVLAGSAALAFASPQVGADVEPELVISELMINPKDVYDSRGEWIEITNRGVVSTNLEGWTLTDERRENVVLPDLPIGPGQQIVLTRTADPFVNGGAEPDWVYGNQIVLYNLGDRLILSEPDGDEHDRVDWYPESGLTVPDGSSLALQNVDLDGNTPDHWCAATTIMIRGDLGSPGAPNRCEQSATPLVITEILQNPRRTSDFVGEFVEVFNPNTTEVDMAGWTIKDDDYDRFTIDAAVTVAPGGYAVLGIQTGDNGGIPLDFAYGTSMRLHNDYDELVLADREGVLVDRVAWDDGRTFPDPNGASMSLLDPTADNLDGSNWCASTGAWAYGDKGTPGTPTWCVSPDANPIVITEIMSDPETPRSERTAEWFELANLGEQPIDLSGWTITAGDWKIHTIDGLTIEPGELAVLAASNDPVLNGDLSPDYIFGSDLPLYNRSGRLILKNANGVIIDRVEWKAERGFPIPSGKSITVGFPTADNALGPNWCASTTRWAVGDFGSPGVLGTCEAPPAPPALVISELMRNPAVVWDSRGEWLEVRNDSDTDVNLRGWSIGDHDSDLHVIAADVIVPGHGYAVLGRDADMSRNGGAPVAYAFGGSVVLANSTDESVLRDQYGQLVDELSWTRDAALRPNGASIALTDAGWCVSGPQFGLGDLGTPGAPNDCTPLDHVDVVISEVHHDPGAVSDTVGEWLEITNASDQPVDIEGWQIRDDDADRHVIHTGAPWVLEPGQAVVLGRDASAQLNGGAPVDYAYGADFPMVDGADEITLLDADLIWVDRVVWNSSQSLPVAPGVSASLRDLFADNAAPSNWCQSVTTFGPLGEYGTPGRPNLCELPTPETTVPETTIPETTVPETTIPETTVPEITIPETTVPETTVPETTVPETTVPEPIERPLSNGFGILAIADASCGGGIGLSGSSIQVEGGARSNGDVKISGSKVSLLGPISHGGKAKVGKMTDAAGIVHDPTPVVPVMQYQVADFAPGTQWSTAAGYVFHDEDWTTQREASPSIHYVDGDVTVDGAVADLSGMTIVATGTITVSGASTLSPFSADLPTLLAGGGDCDDPGIELSGSQVEWTGLLAALNGELQISGSAIRGGSIMAGSIKISGSDILLK